MATILRNAPFLLGYILTYCTMIDSSSQSTRLAHSTTEGTRETLIDQPRVQSGREVKGGGHERQGIRG